MDYIGRKWRFLALLAGLLILNGLVWYHALKPDRPGQEARDRAG